MTDHTQGSPADAGWTHRAFTMPDVLDKVWCRKREGGWDYAVSLDARHANHFGIAHGGALMTFMDHGMSLLLWEATGRARCSTVQLDNHFLHAVQVPAFVELDAEITRRGERLIFARGRLRVGEVIVMESTGIWSVHRGGSRPAPDGDR